MSVIVAYCRPPDDRIDKVGPYALVYLALNQASCNALYTKSADQFAENRRGEFRQDTRRFAACSGQYVMAARSRDIMPGTHRPLRTRRADTSLRSAQALGDYPRGEVAPTRPGEMALRGIVSSRRLPHSFWRRSTQSLRLSSC